MLTFEHIHMYKYVFVQIQIPPFTVTDYNFSLIMPRETVVGSLHFFFLICPECIAYDPCIKESSLNLTTQPHSFSSTGVLVLYLNIP